MPRAGAESVIRAIGWLDSDRVVLDERLGQPGLPRSEPDRWIPLLFLHAGCLLAFFTGVSALAVEVCILLYCVRMFAITGFYHRYFSHRTFKTSRAVQLFFALLGSMSVQRGPLWWAAHHRWHHANSDTELDVHSPNARDFVWSHLGWIASTKNMVTDYQRVTDFAEFPELRFVNRFDWMMPAVLLIALYATGEWLRLSHPNLGTSGPQLVVWGFFISTTLLLNATACINSLAHMFGSRRYNTPDGSRNNPLLALVTFGEGWHNNHHKYSHCARQGFAWWEIDLTYYGLRLLEFFGLVWDLKPVPKNALQETDIVNNRRIEVKAR